MGRQRVDMGPIKRKDRRQVTFTKRKAGLFKKASEISVLSGAHVTVVAFSGAGRPFVLCTGGAAAAASLLRSDAASLVVVDDDDGGNAKVEALVQLMEEKSRNVKEVEDRMSAVGAAVVHAQRRTGRRHWWETEPAALETAELLPEFEKALQRLRDNVSRRVNHQLKPTALPPSPPPAMAHRADGTSTSHRWS